MRKNFWVTLTCSLGVLAFGAHAMTAHKSPTAARKASVKSAVKTTNTKKSFLARPSERRQMSPSADRYREIQEALVQKGYLAPEQVSGQWTDASGEALKRFQIDQSLDGSGKINALSLIALGLGPKRDAASSVTPTPADVSPSPAPGQ